MSSRIYGGRGLSVVSHLIHRETGVRWGDVGCVILISRTSGLPQIDGDVGVTDRVRTVSHPRVVRTDRGTTRVSGDWLVLWVE